MALLFVNMIGTAADLCITFAGSLNLSMRVIHAVAAWAAACLHLSQLVEVTLHADGVDHDEGQDHRQKHHDSHGYRSLFLVSFYLDRH